MVNDDNKKDYVEKMSLYYLYKEVKDEMKAFLKGFHQVIPLNIISVFDFEEL